MRPLGFQALTEGAPGVNTTQLLDAAGKVRPYAAVVDHIDRYIDLRDSELVRLPILRVINKDDAEWHQKVTPAEWVRMMGSVFESGQIYLQCLNEPNGYVDMKPLATWLIEVMRIVPSHVTLVVSNFAVGHPDKLRVVGGEFDELLKAVAQSRHWLGVHEYFKDDPLVQPDRNYHIGRWTMFDERLERLRLFDNVKYPQIKIVVTEFGRDVGGGRGRNGDGWKSAGWSADEYASKLINAAQDIYTKRTPPIPLCVFCLGGGFSLGDDGQEWESFAIDDTILGRMETANNNINAPTGTLPPTKPGCSPVAWVVRKIKTAAAGAFFRKQASTEADKWFAMAGNVILSVDYNPEGDVLEGARTWRNFRINDNVGYLRDDAADFVKEPAPPAPPAPPPNANVVFTIAELHAIASSLTAIYEQIGVLRDVLNAAAERAAVGKAA